MIAQLKYSFHNPARKNRVGAVLLLALLVFMCSSCDLIQSKEDERTQVRFASFVQGTSAVNVQIGGETVAAAVFDASLTPDVDEPAPAYSVIDAGRLRYQASSADGNSEVLLRGNVVLEEDARYTGILTGTRDDASLTIVADSLPESAGESSHLRVVNANRRTGGVDVTVHKVEAGPSGGLSEGELLDRMEGVSYNEVSESLQIDEPVVAVIVSAAIGGSNALLIELNEGELYTLVITQPPTGLGSSGFAFGVFREPLERFIPVSGAKMDGDAFSAYANAMHYPIAYNVIAAPAIRAYY